MPPRPPPPSRERSRSPLSRRQEGLTAALETERNAKTRRGGRQARGRTRGIHVGILEIFRQRIIRILQFLIVGTERHLVHTSRLQQVDQRLNFLRAGGNPEDKRTVLPSLNT